MTELSYVWTCSTTGDGGAQSFSMEIFEVINRVLHNKMPLDNGIIYYNDKTVLPLPGFTGTSDGNLQATNPLANTIQIASGLAMVQGWFYASDSAINVNVAGGNANAVDIIGLRRDVTLQTVRLFHGQGAAGSTYNLVQTATTWEIPLVEATLDGSGNLSSYEYVGKAVSTPSRVLLQEIDVENLYEWTFSGIPAIFTNLVVEFSGAVKDTPTASGKPYLCCQMNGLTTTGHYSQPTPANDLYWWVTTETVIPDDNTHPTLAGAHFQMNFRNYTNRSADWGTHFIGENMATLTASIVRGGQYGHLQATMANQIISSLQFKLYDMDAGGFVAITNTSYAFRADSICRLYGEV